MKIKDVPYRDHRRDWLERDEVKEWVQSRPGVIAMINHVEELLERTLDFLTILDAGCKEGWTGEYLDGRYEGVVVRSVELLPKFVEYAQSLGRDHVVQGNVCALPSRWNQSFDLVLCRHVLGLVEDAEIAFSELHRVSKKWVYIVTHIPGNPEKHYCYLDDPAQLINWLKRNSRFRTLYYGPNPKNFKHQDKKRVEYVMMTERVR